MKPSNIQVAVLLLFSCACGVAAWHLLAPSASAWQRVITPPSCIDGYADTEAGWQKLHQKHNKEYFGGKLRATTVISSDDPAKFGDEAETLWAGEVPTIKIAPSKMATLNAAELVLFHEECHVEGGPPQDGVDGHGPRWKGCMRRLALSGAFEDLW